MRTALEVFERSEFRRTMEKFEYPTTTLTVDSYIVGSTRHHSERIRDMLRDVKVLVDPKKCKDNGNLFKFPKRNQCLYETFYRKDNIKKALDKLKHLLYGEYVLTDNDERLINRPGIPVKPLRPSISWFALAFDIEGEDYLHEWVQGSEYACMPEFLKKDFKPVKIRRGVVYSVTNDGVVEAERGKPVKKALYVHRYSNMYFMEEYLGPNWKSIEDVYEKLERDCPISKFPYHLPIIGRIGPLASRRYNGTSEFLLNFRKSIKFMTPFSSSKHVDVGYRVIRDPTVEMLTSNLNWGRSDFAKIRRLKP